MKLIGIFTALMLFAGCATHTGQASRSDSDFGYLSLHWEAAEGSSDVRWHEFARSGERIALDPVVVLDLRHFTAAHTVRDEGGSHSVVLLMTGEARQHMKAVSSKNVGRQLAIVVAGEVCGVGLVSRTIDSDSFNLPPSEDGQAAEELAWRINLAVSEM